MSLVCAKFSNHSRRSMHVDVDVALTTHFRCCGRYSERSHWGTQATRLRRWIRIDDCWRLLSQSSVTLTLEGPQNLIPLWVPSLYLPHKTLVCINCWPMTVFMQLCFEVDFQWRNASAVLKRMTWLASYWQTTSAHCWQLRHLGGYQLAKWQ